jgi:NAD(P)-dependent dehydrogenase (short-subunit alcohol dehydrogenase family)
MVWTVRDKTVLVTGATNGIGLEAAADLASRGARVVMVGRDAARTAAAEATVRTRHPDAAVSHLICDFASQASIRQLAAAFRAEHRRLDVLINNAGGVNKARWETADGIEATFAVNHLGYFLLTYLLADLLVASAPARVISVASRAHARGTLDFDDLGYARGGYLIMRAYARSKLANVLFAGELARRLAGTGVTSNSLHPGVVATGIWAGAPGLARVFIAVVLRHFFISPAAGAAHLVRLAIDPALSTSSGRYFDRDQDVPPAALARDPAASARLWAESARLVGVSPELPTAPRA